MDSVQQAFNNAELDEAADINIIEHWEALVHMQLKPLFDRPTGTESREQPAEMEIGKSWTVDEYIICALVLHTSSIQNEIIDLRSRGINVAEEEEIKH